MMQAPYVPPEVGKLFCDIADGMLLNVSRCYYSKMSIHRGDWPEAIPWAIAAINMRDSPEPIVSKVRELESLLLEHGYITERSEGSFKSP